MRGRVYQRRATSDLEILRGLLVRLSNRQYRCLETEPLKTCSAGDRPETGDAKQTGNNEINVCASVHERFK